MQCICALAMLAIAVPAVQVPGATSATDRALARLEVLLQPGRQVDAFVSRPMIWPGARAIERPQLPPMIFTGLPPGLTQLVVAKVPMPRPMPEGQPPAAQAPGPKPIELPTKPLVQLPAADADEPLPLPILARPKPDRASLDDATLEASQAAALERVRPRRTEHVPFAPLNLPDPFENVRAGALRNPPAESDQPPAVPIRTPGR
jgi:hypothetical protein